MTKASVEANTSLFLRLPNKLLKLIDLVPDTVIDLGKPGTVPSNALVGRCYHRTYEVLDASPYLQPISPSLLNAETVESSPDDLPKTNQNTIDSSTRQNLTQSEIESLKRGPITGTALITKLVENHTALAEKTSYSKAKYLLRKRTKYLKRITLLPMSIPNLTTHLLDKDPSRIMHIRPETLSLLLSHANIHYSSAKRYLVIDETGGLVVAAMAERMGLLSTHYRDLPTSHGRDSPPSRYRDFPLPARGNSITLLHTSIQPNISLLKHFGYDSNSPDSTHALHTHLKPLSWLQLLHPGEDGMYTEPPGVGAEELGGYKPAKRASYFRKRRRWERCRSIVDETRRGGFDGLVVVSCLEPVGALGHLLPLVKGG
ncbi:eukaryotic initiation factor 3, gamma subunit, partial [Piedraia hortae CBS 480.64]